MEVRTFLQAHNLCARRLPRLLAPTPTAIGVGAWTILSY